MSPSTGSYRNDKNVVVLITFVLGWFTVQFSMFEYDLNILQNFFKALYLLAFQCFVCVAPQRGNREYSIIYEDGSQHFFQSIFESL